MTLFGHSITTYGLLIAFAVLAASTQLICLGDQQHRQTTLTFAPIAIILGLLASRALYALSDSDYSMVASVKAFFTLSAGGFSMMGALFGAAIAALIACKIDRHPLPGFLDRLAPALMLLVAVARLGEGTVPGFGISRPLTQEIGIAPFLMLKDEYDIYLKTWVLEAATALALSILMVLRLQKKQKPGSVFLTACILFGLTQILLESLRYDDHMRFSFIGLQQVLSACIYGVPLLLIGIRSLKHAKKPAAALIVSVPLVVALAIGFEFLIDRSGLNKGLLYLGYALTLALPASLGLRLLKRTA